MTRSLRLAKLVQGIALVGSMACFVDQPTGIDRVCPPGEETCVCLEGQECRLGLTCMEDGRCRDPRCIDGQMGCQCIDGMLCDSGLECLDASCLVRGGETTAGETGVVDSGPVTSTTTPGPSTSDTAPGTVSDPSVSETLLDSGEVGPISVGTLSDTGVVTDTDASLCGCGWRTKGPFYDCGLETLDADPAGAHPRDCPQGVEFFYGDVVSHACDEVDPPITWEGCCLGDVVVFCDGDIAFVECNDEHIACEVW